MPQSPTPPRGASSRGGTSRRTPPTKVSKPFPWGTVLGSLVLAVVLIGVVTYAALNQGSGISGVIADPDNNIDGVVVVDAATLTRNHVQGQVDYPEVPPTGGDHNAAPQQCAVYTAEIAPEHALHSLEHGAVWVTYSPEVDSDEVEALAAKVSGDPYLLMSPVAEQENPIMVTAWARQLSLDSAADDRLDDFITAYSRTGPQTPERGAACVGNTSTGPVQAAAPNGAIQPSAPAAVESAPPAVESAPPAVEPSAVAPVVPSPAAS